MILEVDAIRDAEALSALTRDVEALEWRDGCSTAGAVAKAVKRNQQAVLDGKSGKAVREAIMPCITGNPLVKMAARPRRFSRIMISKTGVGDHYGPHVDNALMGQGEGRMRSDISYTLFLTPPDHYEGGELVIHGQSHSTQVKSQAGHLVLYPSSSIHEVRPVTAGERMVCVGWIESLIADLTQRELLFDLESARSTLRQSLPQDAPGLLKLDKAIANLNRMWSAL